MRALVPLSRMTIVRGRAPRIGIVALNVRASSSTCIGGRSATPWETMVRHRSTGSPVGPSSGSVSSTTRICHVGVLGIDVGGTFTDAVLVEDGEVRTAKVPTARHQEESVVAAADAVDARDVERFTHGTTVATNALLERKGARTAFVATAGFEHLLHLRRQNRKHLYRLCESHPEPLVPLERCHGVRERMGREGVVEPLDLDSLPELDAEAVAVCLLFSFRDPAHEQSVAGELRRRLPRAHVVASHEVAPEFREYERASTTAVDAYLRPLLAGYL